MRKALEEVASTSFVAGQHGPVRLPFVDKVEIPAGHVLSALYGNPTSLTAKGSVDDRAFAIKKTLNELRHGAIEEVRDLNGVKTLLPCFVVVHPGTLKRRLIFDGRALNALLTPAKGSVTYETVRDALYLRARYATKLDVEAAFRHVAVAKEHQPYLCFALEGRVYRYKTLPFGLSWSPTLFNAALRPVIDHLRRQGYRLVWYVDDVLITADSVEELDDAATAVVRAMTRARWRVATDKSFPYAYTTIEFLGLSVTYAADGVPSLSVPEVKAEAMVTIVRDAMTAGSIHVSVLRRLAGKLAFCGFVVPALSLATRCIHHAIAAGDRAADGRVRVEGMFAEELAVLRDEIGALPASSRSFLRPSTATTTWTVYSDASATGWGALRLGDGPFIPPSDVPTGDLPRDAARGWAVSGEFSPEEASLSSAAREIRAIIHSISALGTPRRCRLNWHSDATAAVGAIARWSSPSDGVAAALRELLALIRSLDVDLEVTHVLRDCDRMPVADWLSRQGWRDRQAEWKFSKEDFLSVCRHFRVDIDADMFASDRNHQTEVWCSRFLEDRSLGDAFFVRWDARSWWAFPPFSCLSRLAIAIDAFARRCSAVTAAGLAAPRRTTKILLIFPPCPSMPWWSGLDSVIQRRATRQAVVTTGSSRRPRRRRRTAPSAICPDLRLLDGDDAPAPERPRYGLRAALFVFHHV